MQKLINMGLVSLPYKQLSCKISLGFHKAEMFSIYLPLWLLLREHISIPDSLGTLIHRSRKSFHLVCVWCCRLRVERWSRLSAIWSCPKMMKLPRDTVVKLTCFSHTADLRIVPSSQIIFCWKTTYSPEVQMML